MFYSKLMPVADIATKNQLLQEFVVLEGNLKPVQGIMHDCGLLSQFDLKEEREKYKDPFVVYLAAEDNGSVKEFVKKWDFNQISSIPDKLHLWAGMYDRTVAGIDWVLA